MDSWSAAPRVSALGWRLVIAGVALWGALQLRPTHHAATIALLLIVAALALADIYRSLTRRTALPARTEIADDAHDADQLRALLDAVATALFVIDAEGRIVRCNRAARRMAGAMVARLEDVAALDPVTAATVLALPPGARRLVRAKDGRNLLAWCGSFTVPGTAPQRLLSLQWVAGELDAVEIDAWHAMTRVLTHEMMNALAPIVSLAESLKALPEHGPQTARALATIERRATHLLGFVERYRALGDLPRPVPTKFDLAALVIDIVEAMRPTMGEEVVLFSVARPPHPTLILADPQLIERALVNLLQNAAEAVRECPNPKVQIELKADETGTTVIVCDNGHGVAPDQMEEIFVPFFSTKAGSSGIGLPLSRQIASLHDGTLVTRSATSGARFELHLPARNS